MSLMGENELDSLLHDLQKFYDERSSNATNYDLLMRRSDELRETLQGIDFSKVSFCKCEGFASKEYVDRRISEILEGLNKPSD